MMKPNTQVLITEDCRDGGTATGQIGTYEGDFPLTIALNSGQGWIAEVDYEAYMRGNLRGVAGDPAGDIWPLWQKGTPQPEGPFAMPIDNPRIRLADGSVIWGCECWWQAAETAPVTLEEAKIDLKEFKELLRGLADLLRNEATESS
jgi:hypothetical protein